MEHPTFTERLIQRLSELEFDGLDASFITNLLEYGGLYSPKYEIALLVEADSKDPGVMYQRISKRDIQHEIEHAGPGFQSFTGGTLPANTERYMDAIQSLMLYNGGWHANDHAWKRLSDLTERQLLEGIAEMLPDEEPRTLPPDFWLWVEAHDLSMWNLPEQIGKIDRIETVRLFDRNVHVHCCEITPSYEMWPVETRATLKPEFADDEAIRDEIEEVVSCNSLYEIEYRHVHSLEFLRESHPERFKRMSVDGPHVPYEDVSYDEQREATIEHCRCNQQI